MVVFLNSRDGTKLARNGAAFPPCTCETIAPRRDQAYDVLGDETKRKDYDRRSAGRGGRPRQQQPRQQKKAPFHDLESATKPTSWKSFVQEVEDRQHVMLVVGFRTNCDVHCKQAEKWIEADAGKLQVVCVCAAI